MSSRTRQTAIAAALKGHSELTVKELAELCDTSEITIRRDLTALAAKGLVVRTHGGAMLPETTSFHQKDQRNAEAKAHIGQLAATFIEAGDVIFMDCGSTVFQMCAHLRKLERLTIITNSLPIVTELLGQPGFYFNLVGGEIDAGRRAVHGSMALEHISRYRAAKAFVGVDGISLAGGLSASSEKEASITLAMARQANETFLLCDSSKIEVDSYLAFAPVSMVSSLVTDRGLPLETRKKYEEAGVRVVN